VKGLIQDLTVKETARRDIALIALDHALPGKADNAFVADIAGRIFETINEPENKLNGIAYKIVERRNPEKAEQYRKIVDNLINVNYQQFLKDSTIHDTTNNITYKWPSYVSGIYSNIVYIQFSPDNKRKIAESIRLKINNDKIGINAPGVEYINKSFKNKIIYYYDEDRIAALNLMEKSKEILKSENIEIKDISIEFYNDKKYDASNGLIELWLNL
jgi:hypothetical protein